MKNDTIYLRHILEAIEKIEHYLLNTTYKSFSANDMMIDAVVRELEIIGEASSKLSKEFKDNHPDVAFRDATDMRNFLIHEYFGVRKEIVWDTCKEDLPKVKKLIDDLLD
jgi:uncharacterized protein with HEPN domain